MYYKYGTKTELLGGQARTIGIKQLLKRRHVFPEVYDIAQIYKWGLLQNCIHHFKFRLKLTVWTICAISSIEPSLVILSQTIITWRPNNTKTNWSQHVINTVNYNFHQIEALNILMLSKRYESTEVDFRTWQYVSSGFIVNQQGHLLSCWISKRDFYKIRHANLTSDVHLGIIEKNIHAQIGETLTFYQHFFQNRRSFWTMT